ncbi:RsmB/NOP family class I SAM-dependent RNA methyltransferase [Sulfuritalea hydrogenivorans]|uniref:Fmu (Sun) domain-containing protein n=1 Tax=Sulfuritalea hydrogenivorans sk43H TaxID=1223802 RepID=W0SGM6_9PROT|nr:RsmB/NOP family class I SAM-dependent RNA methyltransferase [Sulfuritalea hydrogenivorans]BAO30439.1 Fmu (Sun) domain-containing protein [Sulfuritalea hydrogenivorans sk43H]
MIARRQRTDDRGQKPAGSEAPTADGLAADLLNAAVAATAQLLTFNQPADAALSAFFRARKSGAKDRAFIAETAYAVLRRKRLLERLAACGPNLEPSFLAPGATPKRAPKTPGARRISPRELVLLSLSRVRGMSQRQLENALMPGEAEWLAEIRRQPEPELTLAEQLDFPDWLVERLAPRMPAEELLALARALNTPAPLDLRVNTLKAEREDVIKRLAADNIAATPCPYSPLGLRLKTKPYLAKHPAYLDGSIEVQDEGSQLLGLLLAPKRSEMVVDFCAGAGGKTLILGALMRSTGRLYAFDVSDKRLAKLKPRAARAGLSNVHPACLSGENDTRVKRLQGKVDRVLVDAPCSGLGTLRRNPDLKWRQSPQSVDELSAKQAAILAAAAKLLRPGGRLVYATCSILAEENEAIVDAFLAAHADFHRLSAQEILAAQGIVIDCGEDMRLSPQQHGTDAFYAAVLERAK